VSTTLQQVPTDTYTVDPVHSSFGFGVKYNGLATFRSNFDKVDAQLADGVLTGSADVRSIVIDEPRFKDHLLAGDFFDVESTPTITFRSTDIRLAEDGGAELDGELTIRGVTKPVTLATELGGFTDGQNGKVLGVSATIEISRTDFEVGKGIPTAVLGDKVKIELDLEAGLQA
jgi:polyisoprenoid-binding protein YceI